LRRAAWTVGDGPACATDHAGRPGTWPCSAFFPMTKWPSGLDARWRRFASGGPGRGLRRRTIGGGDERASRRPGPLGMVGSSAVWISATGTSTLPRTSRSRVCTPPPTAALAAGLPVQPSSRPGPSIICAGCKRWGIAFSQSFARRDRWRSYRAFSSSPSQVPRLKRRVPVQTKISLGSDIWGNKRDTKSDTGQDLALRQPASNLVRLEMTRPSEKIGRS
jgi:hypothetical protein